MNPIKMLLENCSFSAISFWMVGKVDAPPKANKMVPNDRKKLLKPWVLNGTGSVLCKPSITICEKMHTQAIAVVRRAPIPTTLTFKQKNGKS